MSVKSREVIEREAINRMTIIYNERKQIRNLIYFDVSYNMEVYRKKLLEVFKPQMPIYDK